MVKYHIAATGKNAGKWVLCTAEKNCRIGGTHISNNSAAAKEIIDILDTLPPADDIRVARVGFNDNGKELVKTVPVPNQKYIEDIRKAQAEGFEVFEGPWGTNEFDRSVVLEKYDEELGGKFVLWFVDRDFNNGNGTRSPDFSTSAWFKADTVKGYAFPQHAILLDKSEGYSYDALVKGASACDECGKTVGRANLHHVGFASSVCEECYSDTRDRMETPGWAN